ncbi:MAG: carboxypeptidase regulatory-like domain-containing protein, partial [Acidobacteria bacterium]|nr:carboxypeptidase regulatory-like domain-containing protein [Acidobacteriota bacterium]
MRASRLILWTTLFAGLAGAAVLQAQRTTGTISGVVRDESGAVLPGVSVATENLETGFSLTAVTNDAGYYTVPNLSLGEYRLRAELPGFNTVVRGGIKLTVGREAVVDLVLKVGEISEEVLVTEDAPLVETTKAELYDLVDDHQIRDLPLNGRSFTDL